MKRMNYKAHRSDHSHALQNHKHFKGGCNAAPREMVKKEIDVEVVEYETQKPLIIQRITQ